MPPTYEPIPLPQPYQPEVDDPPLPGETGYIQPASQDQTEYQMYKKMGLTDEEIKGIQDTQIRRDIFDNYKANINTITWGETQDPRLSLTQQQELSRLWRSSSNPFNTIQQDIRANPQVTGGGVTTGGVTDTGGGVTDTGGGTTTTGGAINNTTFNPYETPAVNYTPVNTAQSFADIYNQYKGATGGNAPTTADTLLQKYQSGDLAMMNPYTRGLMEYNLMEGNTPYVLTPEGRAAEEQRRIDTLTKSVTEPAAANMGLALTEVQKQMQKSGKLASSATTAGMMRTSEAYSADVAGKIAEGTLGIYGQVGVEINNELNRILQSGMSQNESEVTLRNAGLDAETSTRIAEMNVNAQKDISIINAATSDRIAQIQADTTMSGYEKDIAITQIQAQTQKQVAEINGKYGVDASRAAGESAAVIGATSRELIATKELTAAEKRLSMQLSQDDKVLAQRAYEFGITDINTDGTPRWLTELNQMTITEDKKIELARDRLEREWDMFNITTDEGKRQFDENIKYMIDKMNLDDDQARDIADKYITENARQFDLSDLTQRTQFGVTMQWAKDQYGMDDKRIRELATNTLTEQAREFDLTDKKQTQQFNDSLEWSQKQFYLTDTQIRDIADDTFVNNLAQIRLQNKYLTDENGVPYTYLASIAAIKNSKEISMLDQVPYLDANGELVLDPLTGKWRTVPWQYQSTIKELEQNWDIYEGGVYNNKKDPTDPNNGLTYQALMIKATLIPVDEDGNFDSKGTGFSTPDAYLASIRLPYTDSKGNTLNLPVNVVLGMESIRIESQRADTEIRRLHADSILKILESPSVFEFMGGKDSVKAGILLEGLIDMAALGFDATDEEWTAIINNTIDILNDATADEIVEASGTILVKEGMSITIGTKTTEYNIYRDKDGLYAGKEPRIKAGTTGTTGTTYTTGTPKVGDTRVGENTTGQAINQEWVVNDDHPQGYWRNMGLVSEEDKKGKVWHLFAGVWTQLGKNIK